MLSAAMIGRAFLLIVVIAILGCGEDESAEPSAPAATPAASGASPAPALPGGRAARVENNYENADVHIVAQDPAPFTDPAATVIGPVWDFTVGGADRHAFQSPVTIELPYDPSRVPSGKHVGIAVWERGRWRPVPGATSNALTGTVTAQVNHFSTYGPIAFEPGVHVVSRWYGSGQRTDVSGSSEPDVNPGQTSHTVTSRFTWVFREEAHDLLTYTRLVPESASWSVHMTEKLWIGAGRTGLIHPEQRHGRSYSERELNAPMPADDEARLREHEAEIAALRPQIAALEAQHRTASETDRAAIEGQYEALRSQLHVAELNALSIRFEPRPVFALPGLTRFTDASNQPRVDVGCKYDGTMTRYEYTSNFASWTSAAHADVKVGTVKETASLQLSAPQIEGPPGGPFKKEIDAAESYEYVGIDDAAPRNSEVTLTGRVLHRLRVPDGDGEANVILRDADWVEERVIAPAGTVRVGAWLADAGAIRPPDAPPDSSTTVSEDGRFSLPMYLLPNRQLFLAATWANAEAQLTERQWVGVLANALMRSSVETGAQVPLTEGIQRGGFATVRYAMATKELDLGGGADGGAAGGTLRRTADGLELAFEKSDAILLGSFVFRAPHINQNLETVPVKVDVPPATQERILALCVIPGHESEVRARLHREAPGGVTTINFPGYVVCAPTSCAMALGGLGLSADYRTLPQLIYNYEKAHDGDPAAPPWTFPFSYSWEAYIAVTTGNLGRLMMWQLRDPYTLWPLVPAANHTQKEWLATLTDGYRPWQWGNRLDLGLESAFPNELDVELIDRGPHIDVFSRETSPTVLNRLGAGRLAMISIEHTSRGRTRGRLGPKLGGHYMALVGAVIDNEGTVVRLICNDPYGDLTRHPADEGYYDPRWHTGGPNEKTDVDKTGHAGAYAPYYGPDIKAWDGRLYSKYWLVLKRKDQPQTVATVRGRLLPGD